MPSRPVTAKEAFYICMSMAGVGVAIGVIVLLLVGCADLRPRKVCTMEEWLVTSDCP